MSRVARLQRSPVATRVAAAVLVAAGATGAGVIAVGAAGQAPAAAPLPRAEFDVAPPSPEGGASKPAAPSARTEARDVQEREPSCRSSSGPQRVLIAGLCISAPVVPVPMRGDGSLVIPRDVDQVGLWNGGPGLGQATAGTTLLAGHVDAEGQGLGALYRLAQVQPGEWIDTVDGSGRVSHWRAVALHVVTKAELPGEVFAGRTGPRRLVLVTCGGPIEYAPGHGHTYQDNVIVTAVPA